MHFIFQTVKFNVYFWKQLMKNHSFCQEVSSIKLMVNNERTHCHTQFFQESNPGLVRLQMLDADSGHNLKARYLVDIYVSNKRYRSCFFKDKWVQKMTSQFRQRGSTLLL